MKKRLRKKKKVGEYIEWGCELDITLIDESDFDHFLDLFVSRVEELRCYCGGGGWGKKLSMMVELGRGSHLPASRLQSLLAWAKSCPMVESARSGELFDLWHGEPPVTIV